MFDPSFVLIVFCIFGGFLIGNSIFSKYIRECKNYYRAPRFLKNQQEMDAVNNYVNSHQLYSESIYRRRIFVALPKHYYQHYCKHVDSKKYHFSGGGFVINYPEHIEVYALINNEEVKIQFLKAGLKIDGINFGTWRNVRRTALKLTQGKDELIIQSVLDQENLDLAIFLNPKFAKSHKESFFDKYVVQIFWSQQVSVTAVSSLLMLLVIPLNGSNIDYVILNSFQTLPVIALISFLLGSILFFRLQSQKEDLQESLKFSLEVTVAFFLMVVISMPYLDRYLPGKTMNLATYTVNQDLNFKSLDASLPTLTKEQVVPYLSKAQQHGHVYQFNLLHGILGSWQLLAPNSKVSHFFWYMGITLIGAYFILYKLLYAYRVMFFVQKMYYEQNSLIRKINLSEVCWIHRVFVNKPTFLNQSKKSEFTDYSPGILIEYEQQFVVRFLVDGKQSQRIFPKASLVVEPINNSVSELGCLRFLDKTDLKQRLVFSFDCQESMANMEMLVKPYILISKKTRLAESPKLLSQQTATN